MERVHKTVLAEQWFSILHDVLGQVQTVYRSQGKPLAALAARIGERRETVEAILAGRNGDLEALRDLHNVARGMGFRLKVIIEPVPHDNGIAGDDGK